MADILSQEEIDKLLATPSSEEATAFVQVFKDETVNIIEALIGEKANIELIKEDTFDNRSNSTPAVVQVKITVTGDEDATVMVIFPAIFAATLSDSMMGESLTNREDISEDDLMTIEEVVLNIFRMIANNAHSLSFKIEDIAFISDNENISSQESSKVFTYKMSISSCESTLMLITDNTFNISLKEDDDTENYTALLQELEDFNKLSDDEINEIFQPLQKETKITRLYDYEPEGIKVLKERLENYVREARKNGILALEPVINVEKNPFVYRLFSMAIDGEQYVSIQRYAALAQKWLLQVHKRSKDYANKKKYLFDLEKEFNLIRRAIDVAHHDEKQQEFVEILDDEVAYREDCSQEPPKEEKQILKEIRKCNEKIDNNFDETTLENSAKLIERLVEYSTSARKDGAHILVAKSLKERNPVLRRLLQQVGMNQQIGNLKTIIKDAIEVVKNKAYRDSDFLFDYERELTCIAIAIYMIQSGDAPRFLESSLLVVYPEKNTKSIFE